MPDSTAPTLKINIEADVEKLHKQLVDIKEAIDTLKENSHLELNLTAMYDKTKKSIDKALSDIKNSIEEINRTPIDFQLANEDNTKKAINEIHRVDEALTELGQRVNAISSKFMFLDAKEKRITAIKNSLGRVPGKLSKAEDSIVATTGRIKEAIKDVPDLEIKTSVADITPVLATLTQVTKQLNLAKATINRISNNPEIKKLIGQAAKATPKGVPQEVFGDFAQSFEKAFSQLDIGGSIKTALKGLDLSSLTTSVNELMNKELAEKRKAEFGLEISDKEIKGLKTRLTNLLKEIKKSHGKIPLELTLDIDKLRGRLKVARGELDRFKKTDRFKLPLTLNLADFKKKIKEAREALKKFRESDETKVNLKVVINDANKVLADFNAANSSLLTDKTINVTLAYSEFDKGIKHVKEALSSLKDMTIHINSNVKDVIAKEKVKEEELKEKAKAEKEKAEKEKKPVLESKENYQTMLDNLMKHPLSNGKTPEGNATLQSRLSSIKTLQSAIEHGKAHRDDPNAFLVGIKEEGFLRAQREWLENAIAAVGKNMTVSQAQKKLKKQERLKEQEQREKTQQEYDNRTTALNVKERFQQAKDRQNQNNRNNSVYDESIKHDSSQRKRESDAIRQQMVATDKLERKLKDIKSQYESSFLNANPMTLRRYMQMGDIERNTIAQLDKLNGSGKNHAPVFGSEADYNLYATKFPNSTLAAQMASGRERAQVQRENEESKAQQQQERESARAQKEKDKQETAEATRLAKQEEKLSADIAKQERKLVLLRNQYEDSLLDSNPMKLKKYMQLDRREQEAIAELDRLNGSGTGRTLTFGGRKGYDDYASGFITNHEQAKVNQNNRNNSIFDELMKLEAAENRRQSDLIKEQMQAAAKIEDNLSKIQERLADSKLDGKPMSESKYMRLSDKEQAMISQLHDLNGTERNSVYNGSSGYQQYLNEMRMAGKIATEEEKRNNLIQRRKDIAYAYSQELQKQHQLLESGREVSQKEIDASERQIENIRRKWDNAEWNDGETKPELRQSHLHGKNAKEINQQNSIKNAMAWQSQYFSTANSEVNALTASLERLYTELKRNPGDSGLKGSIKKTTRELARAQIEARKVTKEMNKLNGTLSTGLGNKLKWISGAFGFYESYDILRDSAEVFSDINEGMANLRTVMPAIQHGEGEGQKKTKAEADAAMAAQSRIMVNTAADYGIGIDETIESARLWGRMYKDQNTVNLLTAQSAKLAVADNFSVEESTKAVEAAMFQFGMQAKTTAEALTYSNRIIDVYTKLSHNAGVSAQDLAAGVERSGAVAHQAGMSFEFLNALIAQGTRSTALSGLTNYSPFVLETA